MLKMDVQHIARDPLRVLNIHSAHPHPTPLLLTFAVTVTDDGDKRDVSERDEGDVSDDADDYISRLTV